MICDEFEEINTEQPEVCFNCKKFEHDDLHGPRCVKFPIEEESVCTSCPVSGDVCRDCDDSPILEDDERRGR